MNAPDHVKSREAFGEWEDDLMITERAQGKMNVAFLIERKTRFAVLFRNNARSTAHLMNKRMVVMEHNANRPKDRKTHLEFAPKGPETSARAGRAKAILLVKSP